MTALLVTLLVFPLVGAATASVLRIALPPSRAAALGFVYLAGLGANGSLLYLLGAAGLPLRTATFATIPALAVIVLSLRWPVIAVPDNPREQRHALAGIVLAIPLFVLCAASAVIPTRDYDGRVTWLPKARAIAIEGSVDGPFFQGERGLNLHNRYPLLMPLNAATAMRLSGSTANEAARWLYVLVPIAALIVLRSLLASKYGASGAWTAAAVAWLPVLASIEGGALSGYNDLALTAFFGVALLRLDAVRTAGLFTAFALLAKNEGTALAVAILAAAFVARRRRRVAEWAWLVVPVVGAQALLSWWRMLVPAAYDEQYDVLVASAPASLHRIPSAVRALAVYALDFSEWGGFWIAAAVGLVVAVVMKRGREVAVPFTAIAVALASYTLALTVTSWNIADLAPVVANRLLSHLLIPAACLIAIAVDAIAAMPDRRLTSD